MNQATGNCNRSLFRGGKLGLRAAVAGASLLAGVGCGSNETLILKPFAGQDAGTELIVAEPTELCAVSFITPSPTGIAPILGSTPEACAGPNFSSNVVIATNGQSVQLLVNGLLAGTEQVLDPEGTTLSVVLGNRGADQNTLLARAFMPDGSSCEALYPLDVFVDCQGPSCSLSSAEGQSGELPLSADSEPDQEGFQTPFVVRTPAAQVQLLIDGRPSGEVPELVNGVATFDGVTVPEGDERLVQAVCTDLDGNSVVSPIGSFKVGNSGCQISFVAPGVTALSAFILGGDPETCSGDFTQSFLVSSTAASVVLTVNGGSLPAQPVVGLFSTFSDVVLTNRGSVNNSLVAVGTAANGETCEVTFPGNVLVDCNAPSCILKDPVAGRAFFNAGDNSSGDLEEGFSIDFDVSTDAQNVRLLVDGSPSVQVPILVAGLAQFADVSLTEGVARRVQAVCTDESGNLTRSVIREWTVDTTPCTVAIGALQQQAAVVTPNDDTQGSVTGIQLTAQGTVSGQECEAVRIVDCDEEFGDFNSEGLVQSVWALPLTLPEQSGQWPVCAEVIDAAGNLSAATSTVEVRTELPQLKIITPSHAALIAVEADLIAGNSTCELRVVVDCVDVGSPVSLLANGAVVQAPPGSGEALLANCIADSGVSSPYRGQAVFEVAGVDSADGDTVSLEARQTVQGLVGSSIASGTVEIVTDCIAPNPAFSTALNCGGKTSLGDLLDVVVFNGSSLRVELLVDSADSPEINLGLGTPGGLADSFFDVDVGGRGEALLTAVLLDASGNEGRRTCALTVVDEPTVSIGSPSGGAVFTATSIDCDLVAPGLQIDVTATTNAGPGSSFEISLGAGAVVAGSLVGANIVGCVDAPEGANQSLLISVSDPARPDVGSATAVVTVDTQAPTNAIAQPSATVVARRAGQVQFQWTAVADVGGGVLSAYLLRCSEATIATEAEWNGARSLVVQASPAASGELESETISGFRVGGSVFCLLRGLDAANALTPIEPSANIQVSLEFLQAEYSVADYPNGIELSVAPLGDINGDGIDDFASGATGGGTLIFFGGTQGGGPDVMLTSAEPSFGAKIGVLGDINGDGRSDFSVSAFLSSTGAQGVINGSVFIFYGRDSSNPWPATIDVDGTQGCGADVCLQGTEDSALFGFNTTGADFDGDAISDVIIGAPLVGEGKVYVLRGGSQFASLAPGSIVTVPESNPDGFLIQPPGGNSFFGDAVAAVGPLLQGTSAASDLVVTSTDSNGLLWYVPATPYFGSGLKPGPTAVAIAAGIRVTPLKSVGDVNGDQLPDFIVGDSDGGAQVYLRNINGTFNPTGGAAPNLIPFADDIAIGDSYTSTLAIGFYPGLGLLGDLDQDGVGELLFGARFTAATDATLHYGGQGARPRTLADYVYTTTNTRAIVNFVGDINGDSFNDFAILDGGTGTNRLVLHY